MMIQLEKEKMEDPKEIQITEYNDYYHNPREYGYYGIDPAGIENNIYFYNIYKREELMKKKGYKVVHKYTTPPEVVKFINRNTVNPPL